MLISIDWCLMPTLAVFQLYCSMLLILSRSGNKHGHHRHFYAPATKSRGDILIYPCPSGYRYMACPAISSYSFGATALIFCRMFIHIMEVCMSTGFWFSSNILKMTGSWTWSFFRTSYIKGTWFVRLTPPTVLELQLSYFAGCLYT
jgi:hypothetical protein